MDVHPSSRMSSAKWRHAPALRPRCGNFRWSNKACVLIRSMPSYPTSPRTRSSRRRHGSTERLRPSFLASRSSSTNGLWPSVREVPSPLDFLSSSIKDICPHHWAPVLHAGQPITLVRLETVRLRLTPKYSTPAQGTPAATTGVCTHNTITPSRCGQGF